MRFCGRCNVYTESCVHLDRRLTPRQSPWETRVILLLIFGTLAYVVGGVWGLW